jgi:hypothetical protein
MAPNRTNRKTVDADTSSGTPKMPSVPSAILLTMYEKSLLRKANASGTCSAKRQ